MPVPSMIASIVKLAAVVVAVGVAAAPFQIGRSEQGRPIVVVRAGDAHGTRVLVVGCIHGNECAGIAVIRAFEHAHTPAENLGT